MDVGTEDDWLFANTEPESEPDAGEADADGAELLRREMEAAAKRRGPGSAAPEPDFHMEFKALLVKYGMDDFFYVVRSADGKECLRTWSIPAKVDDEGFRPRAAGLAFECSGLLQHLEGSTWAT